MKNYKLEIIATNNGLINSGTTMLVTDEEEGALTGRIYPKADGFPTTLTLEPTDTDSVYNVEGDDVTEQVAVAGK